MPAIKRERQRGARRSRKRHGDPHEWRTPAQIEAQARLDRDADRDNRALSNTFKFWRVCANVRCRRMHACAGLFDGFSNQWRDAHPDDRFLVREASLARAQGADPQRASEAAQERLAERDALWAKYDAAKEARATRGPDVQPRPEPRIRRL
jgi:hypothetical protein